MFVVSINGVTGFDLVGTLPGARSPSPAREKQSYGCERDDGDRAVQILQTTLLYIINGNIQRGKGSFIVCVSRWKNWWYIVCPAVRFKFFWKSRISLLEVWWLRSWFYDIGGWVSVFQERYLFTRRSSWYSRHNEMPQWRSCYSFSKGHTAIDLHCGHYNTTGKEKKS